MAMYCGECGKTQGAGEYACSDCQCIVWLDYLPGRILSRLSTTPESEPEAELFGFMRDKMRMPPGSVMVIAGPEGIGKTTLALSMFKAPWLVSNEMSAQQVASYRTRLKFSMSGFNAPEWYEGEQRGDPPLCYFGAACEADLVYDSISAAPNERAVLTAAKAYAQEEGARVAVIAHYTKDGQIVGTTKVGHLVDSVIRMEWEHGARVVRIPKTRSGKPGVWPFSMEATEGIQAPTLNGFYSVEGPQQRFRLEKHPASSARFADVLRKAEKDEALRAKLPAPPCAVTARASSLYTHGWAEPDDMPARAAFALSMGVNHWSPVDGQA